VDYIGKAEDWLYPINKKFIHEIAHIAKIVLHGSLVEGDKQVSIDFSPFHDIEWANGAEPRRCFSLTEGEQEAFWLHFLKN
jgi:hypothetical protein